MRPSRMLGGPGRIEVFSGSKGIKGKGSRGSFDKSCPKGGQRIGDKEGLPSHLHTRIFQKVWFWDSSKRDPSPKDLGRLFEMR